MNRYPILFGPHGGLVAGKGFIAHVSIRGRCIIEETGEGFFSALGVNPGAVAGDGASMGEAYRNLLERVRLVVFEIADEADDFEGFAEQVRRFVLETNRLNAADWMAAVARVRAGDLDLEGVRRENADRETEVEILRVAIQPEQDVDHQAPNPSLNEPIETHDDLKIAVGF
jgi:hypothetical protein